MVETKAPGWAKRLEAAIKKSFCFHQDIHQRQYEAHEREKKERLRFKQFLRSQGQEPSVGSETRITPPEQWLSKHMFYDDDASSTRRQPSYDDADAEE